MADVDKLMFTRKHFPLLLFQGTLTSGRKFWSLNEIDIPPYHPSMLDEGIDYRIASELVGEAIEAMTMDLEQASRETRGWMPFGHELEQLARKDGKIHFSPQTFMREDDVLIVNLPIVGTVYVGKKEISPYGTGDGIRIQPNITNTYSVFEKDFTAEIMKEYGLENKTSSVCGRRRFSSPYGWHRHNLSEINAIFYKNMVIALDNAAVRKKYCK